MSWDQPARLAPFPPESPFAGLPVPDDVTVTRQVLAEPDLDLANKTWARLADGTPLVTAEKLGKGWTVLVHTTANTDWSNLALSGLFVQMLRRVVAMSQGVAAATERRAAAAGDARRVRPAAAGRRRRRGRSRATEIATAMPSPRHPPGFYGVADTRRALNLSAAITELKPIGDLPEGVARETFGHKSAEVDFRPPLLTAAFLLALIDLLIAYALRGLLRLRAAPASRPASLLAACSSTGAAPARADDAFVIRATSELRLAYVRTGNQEVDAESRAGLIGLTATLNRRTAVETAEPLAVDVESDELIFFPLLYWPVTAEQPPPSPRAAERINRYLADRRHDPVRHARRRRRDARTVRQRGGPRRPGCAGWSARIKMPSLVPVPPDHVLTKSFYLLHEFPGRWTGGQVWIEPVEDRVNDGVASVIVGGNDWAGAWAIDEQGRPAFAWCPAASRSARWRCGSASTSSCTC